MSEYTLKLPGKAIEIIAAGLGELPAKISMPVIDAIRTQLKEHDDEKLRNAGTSDTQRPSEPEAVG